MLAKLRGQRQAYITESDDGELGVFQIPHTNFLIVGTFWNEMNRWADPRS